MGIRLMLGGVGRRSDGGQANGNMNGGNYPQNGGQHWGNPEPGMVNAYGPRQDYGGNAGMPGRQMNGAMNRGMMHSGHPAENREMGFTAPLRDFMPDKRQEMGPHSEEYMPDMGDIESRHRRSRRTGRFIRGEGDEDPQMRHGSRRDYDDEDERGSYSRSESGEDGGTLAKLKAKFHKLKERLEEAEEAVQSVKELKKEVKRLREKLEDKESEGGKDGKKGKKSKSHENDDDDDDDDPAAGLQKLIEEGVNGKEFLKCLPRALESLLEVIAKPPRTWPDYLEKADYSGIYIMEAKELMKAIEQYKAGQKGIKEVEREMKHTGAALVQMFANLLQNIEQE